MGKEVEVADTPIAYDELRLNVADPEITHVWVLINVGDDCPIGVQGWHHKTFPASIPTIELLEQMWKGDQPVLWPLGVPPEPKVRHVPAGETNRG